MSYERARAWRRGVQAGLELAAAYHEAVARSCAADGDERGAARSTLDAASVRQIPVPADEPKETPS